MSQTPAARIWASLTAAFVACLVLRGLVSTRLHPVDDAYITYRYAAKVAAGEGFVYNPGERHLGTTSPLLTLALALGAVLGLDIPTTGLWLGLVASAAGCALLLDIVRVQTGRVAGGIAASALLALSASQAEIAVSGMETSLLDVLMLGSYRALLGGRLVSAAGAAGLAAVTRPEGVIWLLLVLPFLRRQHRWDAGALGLAVLPLGLWLAWASWYFGSPVPHTVGIKALQGTLLGFTAGGVTASLAAPWGGPFLALALVSAGLALASRPAHRHLLIPAGFALLVAAGYALRHPVIHSWYRGPWDVALTLLIGVIISASLVGMDLKSSALSAAPARVAGIIASMLFFLLLLFRQGEKPWDYLRWKPSVEPHRELARWLNSHTRPGESILVGDVGYVGYHNLDRPVYDYLGLVWPTDLDEMAAIGLPLTGGALVHWAAARLRPRWIALTGPELLRNGVPPGYVAERIAELADYWCLRPVDSAPVPAAGPGGRTERQGARPTRSPRTTIRGEGGRRCDERCAWPRFCAAG